MKRYNYWNYVKTGGWEIDYNFLYNNKNVCVNHHSHPAYSILFLPLDHGKYKKIWYFQRNGKLETHYTIKDYSNTDKILEDSYPAHKKHQWFYESPFITSRGDYNMKVWGRDNIDGAPTVFYECYEHIRAAHINNNPHIMMGYYGSLGVDDNITHDMENLSPPCPPSPADFEFIREDYKKKINIVPYKENIPNLVENFIKYGSMGAAQWKRGEDYFINDCVRRVKNHKKTYHLITSMLEYNGIDYIPFNLDRDDYTNFFELDKWLPLDKCQSDHNVRMKCMPIKYHKKLPDLISKVLCLM